MKPFEFMDALSDVNEAYVRQMLNETDADAPAGTHKAGGAILNIPITMTAGSGVRSDEGRRTGTDKPSGGKLRYLVLLASAAACIAGVFGIMKLYPGGSEESMTAEPQFTEVQETQTEPAVTQLTEAKAVIPVTTKTETKLKSGTTAPVTVQTVAGTAAAETGTVTAGTQVQTSAQAAAKTKPAETTAAPRSTTTTAKTTRTTTTEPETTVTTTTTVPQPGENEPTGCDYYQPYTQSYLLGDVDADGDVTLIDYFLAEREYYIQDWQAPQGFTSIPLDAEALDRGNVDRIMEKVRPFGASEDIFIRLSAMDVSHIQDLAVLRLWPGLSDMTIQDLITVVYFDDQYFAVTYAGENNHFDVIETIFELRQDLDGVAVVDENMVSTVIPQAVHDFYNDAMTLTDIPGEDIRYHRFVTWSNEEFAQKMDELRAILAAL